MIARCFTTAVLAVLLSALSSRAQEVTLEFVAMPKSVDPIKLQLLLGDGKTMEVELPSTEISQPVKVPALAEYRFGRLVESEDGSSSFKTLATVKPLASSRQLFVFIRRGPEADAGFAVLPYAGGPSGFRSRQFLVLNLSRGEIAGVVGGDQFKLSPGKSKVVSPKEDQGENLCHADLRFLDVKKKEWKPFFTTNWPLQDKRRGLVFIYQKPGSTRPRLHTIVDVYP